MLQASEDAPGSGGLCRGAPVSRISGHQVALASGVLQALCGTTGMLRDAPGPMRFQAAPGGQVGLLAQGNWSTDGQLGSISPSWGRGEAAQDELPGSSGATLGSGAY